jgi:hypothetical protein
MESTRMRPADPPSGRTTDELSLAWEHYDERVIRRLVQDRKIWARALGTGTGDLDPLIEEVMPKGPLRDRALFELSSQRLDENVGEWFLRVSSLYEKIHHQEGMAITELDLTLQFVIGLTSGLTRARIWALRPEKMGDLIEYIAGEHIIKSHLMAPSRRREFLEQSRAELAEQQGLSSANLLGAGASGSTPPHINHRYSWVRANTPTTAGGQGASVESSSAGRANSSPGTSDTNSSRVTRSNPSGPQEALQGQAQTTEDLRADLARITEDNQKLRSISKKMAQRLEEIRCTKEMPPELEDLRKKLGQCPRDEARLLERCLQRYVAMELYSQKLIRDIELLHEELSQRQQRLRKDSRITTLENENRNLRELLERERQRQALAEQGLIASRPLWLSGKELPAEDDRPFLTRHPLTEALVGMGRLQDAPLPEDQPRCQGESTRAPGSSTAARGTSDTSRTGAPPPTTPSRKNHGSKDPSPSRSLVSAEADADPIWRPPSPWLPVSPSRSCELGHERESGTPPLRIASPADQEAVDPGVRGAGESATRPPREEYHQDDEATGPADGLERLRLPQGRSAPLQRGGGFGIKKKVRRSTNGCSRSSMPATPTARPDSATTTRKPSQRSSAASGTLPSSAS